MNIIRFIGALLLALASFLAGLWVAYNDLAISKFFDQFGKLVLPAIIILLVIVVAGLLMTVIVTGRFPFQARIRNWRDKRKLQRA